MITELYIRDFAIIKELRLQLKPGFNVLTGETGAGKSIILDAMALVLGDRADMTMIRAGREEAYVEALFELSDHIQSSLDPLIQEEGLEAERSDSLLLSRELRVSGRNISRINGRTVNLTLLKEVGNRLVDIHGQGEHLSLLKPSSHLPLLDAYAGLGADRELVSEFVTSLRKIQRELHELRQNERAMVQRADLLKFQIEEIEAANLSVGEDDKLLGERKRLSNSEQLLSYTNIAISKISGVDDDSDSAGDMLGQAERSLAQLAALDESLQSLLERLQGLTYQLNDLSAELLDYQTRLEYDPDRLAYIEERIDLISSLKRKYGDGIEDVLELQRTAAIQLEKINLSEKRSEELSLIETKLLSELGLAAQKLSEKRQSAASHLADAVERELEDLSMEHAQFSVEFKRTPDEHGVQIGGKRLAFDESGIDQVQFQISANLGEELRPLAKVASGGETSRLMLALKSVLARVDATPTLIFDEIDQGIGGRVGDVVGRKLWQLTTSSSTGHQAIVVTHLPQMAGYADGHYHVSKEQTRGRTVTEVDELDYQGRVREMAEMLGTSDEHAIGGAESILRQVARLKAASQPAPPLSESIKS
jgi:DNA repair protein RecN (Recombination protein N)